MNGDVKIIDKFLRKSAWVATITKIGLEKCTKIKLTEIT
jgi:hypothetical protein